MRLRHTPRAARDLAEIAEFLQARNPAAALASILRSLQSLSLFPAIGRRQNIAGVRKLITIRYRHPLLNRRRKPRTRSRRAERRADRRPRQGCVRVDRARLARRAGQRRNRRLRPRHRQARTERKGFSLGSSPDAATLFAANKNGSFSSPDQRFAYDTTHGGLFYDARGNAAGSTRLEIATLTNHSTLTASDISFVI